MKQTTKTILVALFTFIFVNVNAQQQPAPKNEILTELNSVVPGKGKVTVYEDEAIAGVLGRSMAPPRTVYTTGDGNQYYRMRGFKIQAFSGNNQRTSRNEAYYKQGLLNTSFPEHETAILFESPFWRLRVGNFQTRQDANAVLTDMKRMFPAFGKEMYVVVDEVKIPVSQLKTGSELESEN